jgi:L-ascorbate metabolism protein UlaG (beta-lactamase superfamily)
VGFLIGATATVLHVGDADPRPSNFALLGDLPRVDLALLPFWYVLDEESRAFVRSSIAPRRIFAMHLPPEDASRVAGRLGAARVAVALPGTHGSAVVVD